MNILIEGLEFSQKTDFQKALALHLSRTGYLVETSQDCLHPGNPLASLAHTLQAEADASPCELSCLWLASHLWDLRHLAPSQGIHLQLGSHYRHRAWALTLGLDLPWPADKRVAYDQVLFFTSSLPVRQWRALLRQRRNQSLQVRERLLLDNPDQFLALEHHLRQLLRPLPGFVEIDSSRMTTQEILQTHGGKRFNLLTCQG